MDYLQDKDLKNYTQISTYFSDAIFGWDSVSEKNIENIDFNYYVKLIYKNDYLSLDIKNTIKDDAKKVFYEFNSKSNYCSLDEYKYVTERNQKFHLYMAYIQENFIANNLIYTDYNLLNYTLSVPLKYREQKKLLDYLLDNHFKNISSRFQWGSKFSGYIEFYWFKFLNRVNAILRPVTKGHIQLFNKYQTEEQDRLLYRDFHGDLKEATEKFVNLGLMSLDQKKYWDNLPIRTNGIGERYYIIGVAKLIK